MVLNILKIGNKKRVKEFSSTRQEFFLIRQDVFKISQEKK